MRAGTMRYSVTFYAHTETITATGAKRKVLTELVTVRCARDRKTDYAVMTAGEEFNAGRLTIRVRKNSAYSSADALQFDGQMYHIESQLYNHEDNTYTIISTKIND